MQKLDTRIEKNGFVYNQIKRNDRVAIYEQRDKSGVLHGHEVFIIGIRKGGRVFGRVYPTREYFPTNEDFGLTAFSTGMSLDKAMERYKGLVLMIEQELRVKEREGKK